VTRVLVTGAAGAIGVHVVRHLLVHTDWEITAITRHRYTVGQPQPWSLSMRRQRWLLDGQYPGHEPVTWISQDLGMVSARWLESTAGRADYIIHLAAASDLQAIATNPMSPVLANVAGTVNLLEYARKVQPAAFLHLSTHEVHGPTFGTNGHIEGGHHRPANAYAASKAAAEDLCHAWWRSYEVPLILANTVNNYGPMQRPNKLPVILQQAITEREPIQLRDPLWTSRNWAHSADVADAIVWMLRNVKPHAHAEGMLDAPTRFHIGGQWMTHEEMATGIGAALGIEPDFSRCDRGRPAEDANYGLEDLALWEAGWRAKVAPADRLESSVRWLAKHPKWMVPDA
jgi:dTDP-glucose 4,6-dehydratase